jgi:dihydroxyacetone kinase
VTEALAVLYKCTSFSSSVWMVLHSLEPISLCLVHIQLFSFVDTRARPPSRTLVDPLAAFVFALSKPGATISEAVDAAHAAADATRRLQATAGRGAYVDRSRLEASNVPDPGAWGVWVILNALRGVEVEEG